jgi:DNA-binding CsgD family transcriptional regulator/predicted nucleic acid-binding protein
MESFVGRRRELGVLDARLREAGRGQPRVVQVQGPAGIGKTSLLDQFIAEAGGAADGRAAPITVLRASGEEAETLLAYGVLDQLARSAGPAGEALREATAHATPDPIFAGTRLLELLGEAESSGPVLLVVDDLHWADQPSVRAVVFALRRLVADPVLALLAVRDDAVAALPDSLRRVVSGYQGAVVRLPGLDERDLGELATALGIASFPARAARRLREGTRGNPLHARAVLDEFAADAWDDRRQPLPSPRSFRLLVGDRYAACADDTRRLVDATAVLGVRSSLPLAATVGDVAAPVPAADEAVRRGLLVAETARHPWVVVFPHPLVRSAVYDVLGPARRAALHRAAAAVVEDEVAVLHHRVAAAAAPDGVLADDLEAFAHRAVAGQQWQSAAWHLVESGRLCPDREEGRHRLLVALSWMVQAGDAASAATLADDLRAMPSGPLRDSVLGSLAMARDDPAGAEDLFESAWKRCDASTDPEVAGTIALQSAVHRFGRLDGAGTVEWCSRALELAGPGGAVARTARTYLAHGLGYAGRTPEAFAAVVSAEGDPADPEVDWLQPRSARGILRLVEDDLDGARSDFAAVATRGYELGVLNVATFAFAYLARAEYLAGAWDDAVVHAERAVAVNVESDWRFQWPMLTGIAALVPAARGEWAAAEAALRGATGRYPGDYERSVVAIAMSRARIAEARGDAAGLVAALEPVRSFPVRDGVDEPGFWAWQDLYAEGLVGLGRPVEADTMLAPHEDRAAQRGRCSSIARLARARGRVEAALGRAERAAEAFEHALDAARRVPLPFERAKVELAAGGFWRRAGQRRKAADLLTAAAATFDRLGAAPYAQRCLIELGGSGLEPASRDGSGALLTSQELVVARLAAAGRTNKEIAADLVVSVKTVEYHLRNAFLKLGVQRRRQLAERLAELPARACRSTAAFD